MTISTNEKPTIYRNLYENTGPVYHDRMTFLQSAILFLYIQINVTQHILVLY